MWRVLIQSLILATGGLFSVGAIILVILLLISARGWINGLAYVLGYWGTYTVFALAMVLGGFTASDSRGSEPGVVLSVLFLVLCILMFVITAWYWLKPAEETRASVTSRLLALVDNATPLRTFAVGVLFPVTNFRNLAILLAAVSVTHLSGLALVSRIAIAVAVTFVFCLSVILPVLIYVLFPRRAKALLVRTKQVLEKYSRPIGIWVPLVFGVVFMLRGIRGLL